MTRYDPSTDMSEDNPNPRLRPSTHLLLEKLRNMKRLDDDQLLMVVIDDLVYQRWVKKQNREMLFQLVWKANYYWMNACRRGSFPEGRMTYHETVEAMGGKFIDLEGQHENEESQEA